MKLVGRLQWALALYTNRCGRAYCKPLHAAIHSPMPGFVLSLWCRRALLWFQTFLGLMRRFERSLVQTTRQHIVSWSDAAGHNRMVAVIVLVLGKGWEWIRWQVPTHVLGRFLERHDNYIGLLEMFGVVITHTMAQLAQRRFVDSVL